MKYILTIGLTVLLNTFAVAQCDTELEKYTVGFDSITANSLSFLDAELKDARIVGYGEDTHGTAEFTILAQELMKYLSEKHKFNIFIIETGFGEGQYLNDYIQGKRNDLAVILKEHNSTWRYKTKEFIQLVNALRAYNENHEEKIVLYGCEMQYVISDVNRIREYLTKVGSTYQIDGFEKHIWQPMEESEKTDHYISYIKLKNYFTDNAELFIHKTSEAEFNLVSQHVMVLGQFVTVINQDVVQRKHDFRDLYMAENLQWILNFHGNESKALYWAHNAHVGDWVDNGIVDVAGHQLRKIFGNSYYNIATDFGTGEFIAFSQNGEMKAFSHEHIFENTFTECLKSFGKPNTFLSIRKAKDDKKLMEFLNNELTTMSGAGAQVRNSETETKELGKAFDAVIYLDSTSKINWMTLK